jgi:hypothetical protein
MKRSQMLAVIVAVAAVAIVVTWAVMRRGSGDDGDDDDVVTMSPSPLFPAPLATLPVAPMGITLAPSLATVAISPTLMPQLIGYAGPGDDDYGLVN